MKTIKFSLISAVVMSFMLLTASGALAAYTGLYTNTSGTSSVLLGDSSFEYGGTTYAVQDLGNGLWSASGAGNNFYGVADQGGFAFINSPFQFNDETANATITSAFESFVDSSLNILTGSSPAPEMQLYFNAVALLTTLSEYDIIGSPLGLGLFAADGSSFDLYTSSLSKTGLVNLVLNPSPDTYTRAHTPIPGAVWLLGSGLVGLVGLRRRMKR